MKVINVKQGIGYGECTKLNVTSVGYVQRVNIEFQKVAVAGYTIVISSGDSGAHTRYDEECTSPHLLAEFPPSSPYVLAVGATQLDDETFYPASFAPVCAATHGYLCVQGGYERAVNQSRAYFTSGGGFSNISMSFDAQTAAVTAYFNSGIQLPNATMYNRNGRAYPDVSAVGHNGFVIINGGYELTGGTSQSAPTFAAVLAELNTQYIKITGKPFGWVNALLYQAWTDQPNTFTDVTVGDNICTEAGCARTCQGWYATKGWDPVTGLGTPNYANLLSYIQQLGKRLVEKRAMKKHTA